MRSFLKYLISLTLTHAIVGCSDGTPVNPNGVPDECTIQLDDPTTITTFPDRTMLVADATTETGLRLVYDPARYPDLTARLGGLLPTLTEDLSTVDGFGINAEAFFRFDRPFDPTLLPVPIEDPSASAAGFVVLGDTPRFMPAVLTITEDGTLFLAPLRPLPPRAEVAAYVTRALAKAAGGCLEPSAATAKLLASPDAPTSHAITALIELGAIAHSSDLVAITAYPTQSVYEDGTAIAADIRARDFNFITPPTCEDSEVFTRCNAEFVAGDYRDSQDGVIRRRVGDAAAPIATYTIPLTIWLPRQRSGPVPTVFFQHGLTSDREYGGRRLANHLAPRGMAVVAIDAVEHGAHPTVTEERTALETMQAFFGLSFEKIETRGFQAARARDNLAQSTYDRLQLVRLLSLHADIDGVPGDDLNLDRHALLGVSLGGIMSAQHVALDSGVGAAALIVPGGRIATMMSDSAAFALIVNSFRPPEATPDDMRRLFPLVQTILERGDAAAWAPTIYGTRPAGVTGRPHVLIGIALDDRVMPNIATYALGRALGVPMVEKIVSPEIGFEHVTGPVAGNIMLGDENATGGLLQFDIVDSAKGLVPADHNNVLESAVGHDAWTHFFTTHFAGTAEIHDPYEALGIAHP